MAAPSLETAPSTWTPAGDSPAELIKFQNQMTQVMEEYKARSSGVQAVGTAFNPRA